MNTWRYQIPVHSPLSTAALLMGMRAAISRNGAHRHAAARLETLLRERYRPRAVLLTESGTAALTAALLGLQAAGKANTAVIPAYSCYDIATAAEGAGVPVFLYDLDPNTLAPDLEQLQAALRRGAAAVVVAHLYGCPIDLTEITRLVSQAGAVLIEDAAQGAGATMHGRPLGTQGSLGVFSFGRGKGLTGGSGGALLAFDDIGVRALERARAVLGEPRRGWTELGTITAQLLLERPSLYAVPASLPFLHLGQTRYRHPRPLREPATVSCAVLAAAWDLADREAEIRRANAARLLVALKDQPGFAAIATSPAGRPGYLRLPVIAAAGARRAVADRAARRLGVMPGYPKALCDVEQVGVRCRNRNEDFPGARLLAARVCTLPTHSRLTTGDLIGLERWIGAAGNR